MAEPEAAVSILHALAPEESVLLIRRTERPDDSWSGHWSFPGGRRDPEDRDLLDTALRELQEECGIRLARQQVCAELPHVLARRRVEPYVLVAPFVLRAEVQLPANLDPREAVESRWVPLSLLRDPSRHALAPVPGRPRRLLFPGVGLGKVPLWGFTYRLIMEWLGLQPAGRALHEAGFQAACAVLDAVVSCGLTVLEPWTESAPPGTPSGPSQTAAARVAGPIPAGEIVARFSTPPACLPGINCLEVRPDLIRIVGLAFEEYLIYAAT